MASSVEPERLIVSAAEVLAWTFRVKDLIARDDLPEDVVDTLQELEEWCADVYRVAPRVRAEDRPQGVHTPGAAPR